jgi:hypothetical protein
MPSLTEQWVEAVPWCPQPGPQFDAFMSKADVLLYGGAAGGGKSALACGLAILRHSQTLILRREATQLGGILDEIAGIIDPQRDGYSGQSKEWKIPPWDGVNRKIILGSCPNPGDEMRHQGRPKDLIVFDECANFLESQVRFIMGWLRTTTKNQRTRVLMCSNPPTSSEGLWLVQMFAPWLDPQHPNPASPGELRWFTTIGGKDIEVPSGEPLDIDGEMIYPKSYTFIPAKVQDNKYLGKEYLRELQALPEPLRSQMLYGDFSAGQDDDEYQVIPTSWIKEAMNNWKEMPYENITSAGLDPSRGGRDQTVFSARSGWHFHPLQRWEGQDMATGGAVAAKVIELVGHHRCPVHVDAIGIGAAVVDALDAVIHSRTIPVIASAKAKGKDWSGTMGFSNKRAELWWNFRDLLNPANAQRLTLPPDQQLLADLTAPRYKLAANGIQIEAKTDIVRRIGRSPDSGDAIVMCAERTALMNINGYNRPRHRITGSLSD